MAKKWQKKLKKAGFHVEIDHSQESVSKKVRNAQLAQANYILTVGDQEVENKTVNLRTRDNVVHGQVALEAFIHKAEDEKKIEIALLSLCNSK